MPDLARLQIHAGFSRASLPTDPVARHERDQRQGPQPRKPTPGRRHRRQQPRRRARAGARRQPLCPHRVPLPRAAGRHPRRRRNRLDRRHRRRPSPPRPSAAPHPRRHPSDFSNSHSRKRHSSLPPAPLLGLAAAFLIERYAFGSAARATLATPPLERAAVDRRRDRRGHLDRPACLAAGAGAHGAFRDAGGHHAAAKPLWARLWLDMARSPASALVFWRTGSNGYSLVLAVEGRHRCRSTTTPSSRRSCSGSESGCSRGGSPNLRSDAAPACSRDCSLPLRAALARCRSNNAAAAQATRRCRHAHHAHRRFAGLNSCVQRHVQAASRSRRPTQQRSRHRRDRACGANIGPRPPPAGAPYPASASSSRYNTASRTSAPTSRTSSASTRTRSSRTRACRTGTSKAEPRTSYSRDSPPHPARFSSARKRSPTISCTPETESTSGSSTPAPKS